MPVVLLLSTAQLQATYRYTLAITIIMNSLNLDRLWSQKIDYCKATSYAVTCEKIGFSIAVDKTMIQINGTRIGSILAVGKTKYYSSNAYV